MTETSRENVYPSWFANNDGSLRLLLSNDGDNRDDEYQIRQ